jgi:hypothetical protein
VSWHCAFCEKTEGVTGYITVCNISGGVPFNFVCHLFCLQKVIPSNGIKEAIGLLE